MDECIVCFQNPCKCKFKIFFGILLILLTTGCDKFKPTYEVRQHIFKHCQSVLNDEKKTTHKHCRDVVVYKCGFEIYGAFKIYKLFEKIGPANKYCESLRSENAGDAK